MLLGVFTEVVNLTHGTFVTSILAKIFKILAAILLEDSAIGYVL